MTRRSMMLGWLLLLAVVPLPRPASAQLRPWEPFDWTLFDGDAHATVAVGGSALWRQRASLAGTEGLLIEAGSFSAGFRADRVGLEGGGTIYRYFRERTTFATPAGGAEPRPLGIRHDNGDYRVSTGVLLTDPDRATTALIRFGSRLPTTDNRVGLERDAIDFFATIGARVDRGSLRAIAELGVGIHGTRRDDFEQSDLFLYMAGIETRSGPVRPAILLLGQTIHRDLWFRGTEPLSEIRLRLLAPGRVSVRLEAIHGFSDFSPAAGVSISLLGAL